MTRHGQGMRAGSRWFTEGFDTTDLQEVKTLLEELGINGRTQHVAHTHRPIPYHGKALRQIKCKNPRHLMAHGHFW